MDNRRNAFTAGRIAEACDGRLRHGDPDHTAEGVATDTRRLMPGQAFFALRGERHDGHDYLAAASAQGASVLVAERPPAGWRPPEGVAFVLVEDTARALLDLAGWHRGRLTGRVAAVTGSYGKSTVKEMLGAILGLDSRLTVAPASFNNRIGVALTLLAASPEDEFVVLEMGTNHPGEIDELAAAARPDLGVITAIGEVHLEGLGSLDGVAEAKGELIPHLPADGALVLNADDARCAALAGRFEGTPRTFGLRRGATVRAERIHRVHGGWRFDAAGWVFRLPDGPRHNIINAAAAVCAADALAVPARTAAQALAGFSPPPMRYERRELGGVTFVCDCYNSSPPALRAALESFLLEAAAGRRILVCGEMRELGERGPELHRRAGMEMAASGAELLVAVGELARHFIEGWHRRALPTQGALYFRSAQEAWSPLWWELRPGDAVLVKGSRAMRMETIVERIAEQLGAEGKEAA